LTGVLARRLGLLLLILRVARVLLGAVPVLLPRAVNGLLRVIDALVRALRGLVRLVDRIVRRVLHGLIVGDFASLGGRVLRAVRARLRRGRRADHALDRRDRALDHIARAVPER
jgi:hypothetical protein